MSQNVLYSPTLTSNPVVTVIEFCLQNRISRSFFYKLLRAGQAPRIMKVGKRTLITNEAVEDWRKARAKAA